MRASCIGWAIVLGLSVAAILPANEPGPRDLTKPWGADALFPMQRDYRWGFIDVNGKTVIRAQFEDAGFFFNGLARVRMGRYWGFIDPAGGMVIALRFAAAGDFSGALAPVRIGRRWGFIDRTGRMVVAPAFQGAASFREGMARVEVWSRVRCGGGRVFTQDNAPEFLFRIQSEIERGFDTCEYPLDLKTGYVDGTGRVAIPTRFAEARDFSEGLAAVRMEFTDSGKWGFIDRSGSLVIALQFDEAGDFSQGLAAVLVGRSKRNGIQNPGSYGYIRLSGQFGIEAQFAEAGPFSEGLAAVAFHDRKGKGYIDGAGKLVLPNRYDEAGLFSEGLARVCGWAHRSFMRCVYIDRNGKTVIGSVQADGRFSGGLATAQRSAERAVNVYIDRLGRVVAETGVGLW